MLIKEVPLVLWGVVNDPNPTNLYSVPILIARIAVGIGFGVTVVTIFLRLKMDALRILVVVQSEFGVWLVPRRRLCFF